MPPSPHTRCKNFCPTPPEKDFKAFKNVSDDNDYQFQQYRQNITVEQFTIMSISFTGISLP